MNPDYDNLYGHQQAPSEKVKNAFMGRDPLSVLSVDCLLTMEHAFRNPAGSVAVRQLPQRLLASAKRFLRRAGL